MTTNSTTEINLSNNENDPANGDTGDSWHAPLVAITDPELLTQIADHQDPDNTEPSICDTLLNLLVQMDLCRWLGLPLPTNSHEIARRRAAEFAFGEFLKSLVLSGKKLIAEVQTLMVEYQDCTCTCINYGECVYDYYGGHYTTEWRHTLFAQVASLAEVRKLAELHDPYAESSYDPCGECVFFTIMPA